MSDQLQNIVPETALVLRLKQQDKAALGELYDRYSAALFGVVQKIVRSDEVAEDVLQEAFMKIWKKINTFDEEKGRLFTWLLNITRNTAIDKLRSKAFKNTEKTQEIDQEQMNRGSLSTETPTDQIGLKEIVERLDPKQKVIIDSIYFKGLSQSETAKALDIPLGTVKTRVKLAMNVLRDIYKN